DDIHLSRVPDPFRPKVSESLDSHVQRVMLSSFEAKERVDKQIQQIKELLTSGRVPLAERFVRELMAFQLNRDEQEYAVMSLCNLTSSALEANQNDFADALVEYAMELGPNDIVAFTERAEVYRARGRFAAALDMFDAVIQRFSSQSTYPLNGKANVLSEMGKFGEAAALYRSIQEDFPEHPVAFNGEVSLLHRRGEHRAALRRALENAKRFPLDSVTRGVLGGSLSRNGKYPDAVRHYQQAWKLDSTNVRFVIGAAFAMRSSGKASEALRYLSTYLQDNPGVIPILSAKAAILRGLKRFVEAREVYNAIIQIFPEFAPAKFGLMALDVSQNPDSVAGMELGLDQLESEIDWIGFRTLMVALVKTGKAVTAAQRISEALPICPWLNQRIRLKTVLGIAEMESNQPKCIQTLQENIELLDDRQRQARLLLLSHAQMDQNNFVVGRMLVTNIVNTKDQELAGIRNQILEFSQSSSRNSKSDLLASELEFAIAA
ncbi:MAG: tetratricopeptide repeat protein, partial [Terracidiphilus sp.]